MKRIKLKKKYNLKIINLVRLFLFIILIFLIVSFISKIDLFDSNKELITSLLSTSNYYKKSNINHLPKFTNTIFSSTPTNPISILTSTFNYNMIIDEENYDSSKLSDVSSYITDPNKEEVLEPLVYIYNSHQLENYSKNNIEEYSITPTVMTASYILRDYLKKQNISSIVEEGDISEFIKINNWNYNYSYLASRYFISDAKEKNTSLKYFIDLHRDSISKSSSTIIIDNKSYAKLLFVIGLENKNYSSNLSLANKISELINEKYLNLSKGIMTKQGPNVNGIYNQDLDPNLILIEVGGYENTIDEVSNTLEALSEILKEIIYEN